MNGYVSARIREKDNRAKETGQQLHVERVAEPFQQVPPIVRVSFVERTEGKEIVRQVEVQDYEWRQLIELFHAIYRTDL